MPKAILFTRDVLCKAGELTLFLDSTAVGKHICLNKAPLAYNRWNIVWLCLKIPYNSVVAVVFNVISDLCNCLGATHLAKRCYIISRSFEGEANQAVNLVKYGDQFLCPSINAHALGTEDLYLHFPLPQNSLTPQIIQQFKPPETVDFFTKKGLCLGIVDWFLRLYKKTQKKLPNQEMHLIAIAKEFMYGAPRQAALLHAIKNSSWFHYKVSEIKHTDIQNLIAGAYVIYIEDITKTFVHVLLHFKTDEKDGYLFDPNEGLLKLDSSKITDHLLTTYQRPSVQIFEVLFDKKTKTL